jgi:hypothetical protein
MCLLSHCLATMGVYKEPYDLLWYNKECTEPPTIFYRCMYLLPWEHFYQATDTQKNTYMRARTRTHTHTHTQKTHTRAHTQRLIAGIYEVCGKDWLRCHDMHTKFKNDQLSLSKVHGGDTLIHRQQGYPISLLLFFQTKECRLKMGGGGEQKKKSCWTGRYDH